MYKYDQTADTQAISPHITRMTTVHYGNLAFDVNEKLLLRTGAQEGVHVTSVGGFQMVRGFSFGLSCLGHFQGCKRRWRSTGVVVKALQVSVGVTQEC